MIRLGRRLQMLAAIEISLVLVALILAGALFAFGSYIRTLSNEFAGTANELVAALSKTKIDTALEGGQFAATRLLQYGVEIVVFDNSNRVTVFRARRSDPQPVINVRSRGDLSGEPPAGGPLVPAILGLATAFGLQTVHVHAGTIYLTIGANASALASTVQAYFAPLLIAFAIAILCGYVVARVLTQQALRPLDDVNAALERFAAGDLTPQPISADERHELAPLARAYNGAIAQMERAFAARDQANASIRQFMGDAGHQLRTPLTVVQGFIAILRRNPLAPPAERERILDTMYRTSRAMGSLIDKLILLERWERPQDVAPEPIDVGVLVSDLVSVVAESYPERDISVATQPDALAAIDPSDVQYVIDNLVDNALKYTPGPVDVAVVREDGSVVVTVTDRGPGISTEDAGHIFDRFYRGGGRHDVQGFGLGLSIAKRAVERANGRLAVASSPGKGSRFTVTLPRFVTSKEP